MSDKTPIVTELKSPNGVSFGILEAQDGNIWVGSVDGVYRYNGNTFKAFTKSQK